MKRFSFIFAILFLILHNPLISKAQEGYEDAIYLKTGAIIYGTITENIPNKSVTIKTNEGNILINDWSGIYKTVKVPIGAHKRSDTTFYAKGTRLSGFINITDLNFGRGLGNYVGYNAYSFRMINGYLISPEFSIGLGISYNKCDSFSFIPIFIDCRIYAPEKLSSLYFALDVGPGFGLALNRKETGLMINPEIGEKISLSHTTFLNLGIGYNYQRFSYYDYLVWTTYNYITCLKFNIGLAFG